MRGGGAVGFGLMALALMTACSNADFNRDPQTIFRYNESASITSLDPAFARSQANIWPVHNLFNRLVQLDSSLQVVPDLADWWEITDSGRTYRFHVRSEVYFHACDLFEAGQREVTAHDFVYSFHRLRNPQLASPGAWTLDHVDTLYAPSRDTLVIKLKDAFAPFLSLLTMEYCAVVPQEAVESYGPEFGQRPVGTGPFYFKYWQDQGKLVLRRNSHYHEFDESGVRLPYLEAVSITFVPDKQSAFLEFLKGNLDLISGLDVSYKDELLTADGELNPAYADRVQLLRSPYLNTEYLGILQEGLSADHPLADRRVRNALDLGFDRGALLKYLRNGVGKPADGGMVPDAFPGFSSLPGNAPSPAIRYQPDSAKIWVQEWKSDHPEQPLAIQLQTNSSYQDIAEFLQHQWEQLGVEVSIDVLPPSTLRQMMSTGKTPFFRGSWIADYPDPENYLSLFYGAYRAPFGPNYTRTQSARYDSIYTAAIRTDDGGTRTQHYRQLNAMISRESWAIPLYYDEVLRFVPVSIRGMQPNAVNLLALKRVRKGY